MMKPVSVCFKYVAPSEGTAVETTETFMSVYSPPSGSYMKTLSIGVTNVGIGVTYQVIKRTSTSQGVNFIILNSGSTDALLNINIVFSTGDSLLFYSSSTNTQILISGEEFEIASK